MKPAASLYEEPLFRQAVGQTLRPGGLALTEAALEHCFWVAGDRVAEAGCGAGATLKLLRDRGLIALGFDLSPALVEEARSFSGCPAARADTAALPLKSETLDGLVCECLLSLLDRPEEALAEFRRVLKPGGRLLLADVSRRADPAPAGDAPAGIRKRSCLAGAVTPAETKARLEARGFRLEKVFDHPGALKNLAAQLVWQGLKPSELGRWLGFSCQNPSSGGGFSYGQWIARKSGR